MAAKVSKDEDFLMRRCLWGKSAVYRACDCCGYVFGQIEDGGSYVLPARLPKIGAGSLPVCTFNVICWIAAHK